MTAQARNQRRITVEATAATVAATGKRFCQDHQGFSDVNDGSAIQRGKSVRWTCNPCQNRRAKALVKR